MDPAQIVIRASTQEHLEIEDIKDDIIILKDGGACLVIQVNAINYDLLSEKEQEAIVYAYASFLNSLNFPLQIVIRSQQKDVSFYINLLKQKAEKERKSLIKKQIEKYLKFVEETVQKNNVLDKKFYIAIPMSPLEIGVTKVLTKSFIKRKKLPFDKSYILEKAKINLYPKRDHVLRLLKRMGIEGKQLETKELIKLFFEIYNPETKGQQIVEREQYQEPLVQSFIPSIKPEGVSLEHSGKEDSKENNQNSPSSPPEEESFFNKINSLVKEAKNEI